MSQQQYPLPRNVQLSGQPIYQYADQGQELWQLPQPDYRPSGQPIPLGVPLLAAPFQFGWQLAQQMVEPPGYQLIAVQQNPGFDANPYQLLTVRVVTDPFTGQAYQEVMMPKVIIPTNNGYQSAFQSNLQQSSPLQVPLENYQLADFAVPQRRDVLGLQNQDAQNEMPNASTSRPYFSNQLVPQPVQARPDANPAYQIIDSSEGMPSASNIQSNEGWMEQGSMTSIADTLLSISAANIPLPIAVPETPVSMPRGKTTQSSFIAPGLGERSKSRDQPAATPDRFVPLQSPSGFIGSIPDSPAIKMPSYVEMVSALTSESPNIIQGDRLYTPYNSKPPTPYKGGKTLARIARSERGLDEEGYAPSDFDWSDLSWLPGQASGLQPQEPPRSK